MCSTLRSMLLAINSVQLAVVTLAVLFLTEVRLSRSDGVSNKPQPPVLWETAHHSGEPAQRAKNCVFLLSTDSSSSYPLTSLEEGVRFDIDADGDLEDVAWTQAGSDSPSSRWIATATPASRVCAS
jgi:hypothetical protein